MTKLIRSLPPTQTRAGAFAIVGLVILELVATFFIVAGLLFGADQRLVGLMLGLAFLIGAVMLDVYRKEFIADELVGKTRIPKVVPKREFK